MNGPPKFNAVPDQVVDEKKNLSFTLTAVDPDSTDTLTYAITSPNVPAGVTLDAASGQFSWTPDEAQGPGFYPFQVSVDDGHGHQDQTSFNVTVNEVNDPPVLDAIGDKSVAEGGTLSFAITATDPDPGDQFTYSLDSAPAWVHIDAATGLLTATLDDGPATVPVTVRVTDNGIPPLSDAATFNINVTNVPPAATIAGPADARVTRSATFNFSGTDVSSADQLAGFTWSIQWGDGALQTISAPVASAALSHAYGTIGVYQVQAIATDKDGGASAPAMSKITISGAQLVKDASSSGRSALLVGGAAKGSTIVIKPVAKSTKLNVYLNSSLLGSFNPTGHVIVYGRDGNDTITVGPTGRSVLVYGGGGNDRLTARGDSAVLVGGDGNDTLTGSSAPAS